MNKIKDIQQRLSDMGLYTEIIDGVYGPNTEKAMMKALSMLETINNLHKAALVQSGASTSPKMCWGKKVSPRFKEIVADICKELNMPSEGCDWLMACMAFETGGSFSAQQTNNAGGQAVGLIQFMKATAIGLGTTREKLLEMSDDEQLDVYVREYFKPYKNKLNKIEDVYLAILWPAAIGKPLDFPLWLRDIKYAGAYRSNSGLDINKDGVVSVSEACSKVKASLALGMGDIYYG